MKGMLFSQMEPPAELEDEFNAWYDEEHIPQRLALPQFGRALRYREFGGGRRYLAVYEIDDMGVLATPEYRRLKEQPGERTARMLAAVSGFTRYLCDHVSTTGVESVPHTHLSVVAFDVPQDDHAVIDDWYDTEHSEMLLRADDWLRVRRYTVGSGDGPSWTHLALHELASLDVLDGPERAAAGRAPKRVALTDRPWFTSAGRWVYERIT